MIMLPSKISCLQKYCNSKNTSHVKHTFTHFYENKIERTNPIFNIYSEVKMALETRQSLRTLLPYIIIFFSQNKYEIFFFFQVKGSVVS